MGRRPRLTIDRFGEFFFAENSKSLPLRVYILSYLFCMSCLFIAIGRLLGLPHPVVRAQLCTFMERNLHLDHQGMPVGDWIRWQGQQPRQYIATMRRTATWGGAMEIAMATKLYRADITVVAPGTHRRLAHFVMDDTKSARRQLWLVWTGNHYEPLRRIG